MVLAMGAMRLCLSGVLVGLLTLVGCDGDEAAKKAQALIQKENLPRVQAILKEDLARHEKGLTYAADRVAAGFVKADPERIEEEMRQVLKLVRSPKKGVQELVISPMSFMAAVDKQGVVIARDAEPDKMKGMDLAKLFPEVKQALGGKLSWGIGEFENEVKGGDSSVTIIMAAPSHYEGEIVGGLVLGIPLWRLSQRLSRQLQAEANKPGLVLWVYIYRGDRIFSHGTPPDLNERVPDAAARKAGLAKSPDGFTGTVDQYGYVYAYAVKPIPELGDDAGVIVFRMDPEPE